MTHHFCKDQCLLWIQLSDVFICLTGALGLSFWRNSMYLFPKLIALDILHLQNQLWAAHYGWCTHRAGRLAKLVGPEKGADWSASPEWLCGESSGGGIKPVCLGMEEAGIITQLMETQMLSSQKSSKCFLKSWSEIICRSYFERLWMPFVCVEHGGCHTCSAASRIRPESLSAENVFGELG